MTANHSPSRQPAGSPDGGKFAPGDVGTEAPADALTAAKLPAPGVLIDAIHEYLDENPPPEPDDTDSYCEQMDTWAEGFGAPHELDGSDPAVQEYLVDNANDIVMEVEITHGQDDDSDEWGDACVAVARREYCKAALVHEAGGWAPAGDGRA